MKLRTLSKLEQAIRTPRTPELSPDLSTSIRALSRVDSKALRDASLRAQAIREARESKRNYSIA